MSTAQNYAGRGTSANPTEPTAPPNPSTGQTTAKRPPAPDGRQSMHTNVDEVVYEAQTALLDAVDAYMDWISPIEAINTLLEHWLTCPPTDLSEPKNQSRVSTILNLVNFLDDLRDCNFAVEINATAVAKQGEVNCGN